MPLTLYSMPSSGNSYKVRLLLALLDRPYRHVACENGSQILDDAKTSGKAPLGKVPVLELANGSILAESNAILTYLADGTSWLPADPLEHARVLAWMFFEQNRHETVVAVRASLHCYPHLAQEASPDRMADLLTAGHAILSLIDGHLSGRDWLETDGPTVADIALYAYTHTAGPRGGFDMTRFPDIASWCNRMTALPGYIGLDEIPA